MRKYTLCFQTVLFLQLFHCTRSTNSSDSYSFTPSIWVLNFQTFLQHKKNVTSIHYYNRNNNNNNNTCAKATTITATTGDIVPPFTVAAIQITAVGLVNNDVQGFLDRAIEAVKQAAAKGATLILLPELFLGPYFCQSQDPIWMNIATKVTETNVILSTFQRLATNLSVVLPISIFEQFNNVMYNSVVVFDSDGQNLGTYRKSHIPDGTGYQEKFYFSPGDSGFKVFSTTVGRVGVGICWDQWFPETARSMALMGADVLLYPTAIGSEPQDPTLNSMLHWQRVMQGHAVANVSGMEKLVLQRHHSLIKNSSISCFFADGSCRCLQSTWYRNITPPRWSRAPTYSFLWQIIHH